MTLPADSLAQLRTAMAPMATTGATVQWQAKAGGSFGAAANLSVLIVDDVTTQEDNQRGETISVRRLTVQPLATAAGRLGDKVLYGGVEFIVEAISNLDVPTWVAVFRDSLGGSRNGSFRAMGGGS